MEYNKYNVVWEKHHSYNNKWHTASILKIKLGSVCDDDISNLR